MKLNSVEEIVKATLYEGYMLYPYRPTSVKNRQRWNFGVLYPQSYSEAQRGTDAWTMQTECLLLANQDAALEVRARFLSLIHRQTSAPATAPGELPADSEVNGHSLCFTTGDAEFGQSWQEAVEQEIKAPFVKISELEHQAQRVSFTFSATRTVEPVPANEEQACDGKLAPVIVRTQEYIAGELEVSALRIGDLVKVTVGVFNKTPFADAATATRDEALLRSLVSTHTILAAHEAEFVSLLDPPDQFRSAAAGCRNLGTWPVLVGEEGSRDTMLSSPIILYDYPQIAAESPGDLFDGTEIDEILTLRIMTLTEDEKREMRGADEHARKILERTEMLPAEQLMKMHGAVRGLRRMRDEG